MSPADDTIAAPASPPGPAIRATLRLSGPDAHAILTRCFTPECSAEWNSAHTPRRHAGWFTLPGWRTPIHAHVLYWPGRRSYTAEPVAEIQVPGSPPLVDALLARMYACGARPARAGEFTLRAFLAGRLDLVQAEAVLGVIDAEDHIHLQTALQQLAGGLSSRINQLREQLLLHLADLEAGLDFVEEDIDFVSRHDLRRRLDESIGSIDQLLDRAARRMQSAGRRHVVLAGLPNAGKSTLFNRLVEREAAIVSPYRGTTRDVLSASLDVDGIAVTLWDTAGWDESNHPLERAAGDFRADRLSRADLIVWCTASDLSPAELSHDSSLRNAAAATVPVLWARTKADLPGHAAPAPGVAVSAATGSGIAELLSAIAAQLTGRQPHRAELLATTVARARGSLEQARGALCHALAAVDAAAGDELVSLDLRAGLDALGQVCGAVYTDDILDRIFSRFCIGK